jgi:glycerophosphoryl diester phosphodiesterase
VAIHCPPPCCPLAATLLGVPFFDSSHPLVFAHRGGCALGPENTYAAFERGIAAGADGLELDVHLSADGVVVVHHDETLDRTTSGSGPIAAQTAAELARIDPGDGAGIPTLGEVLRRHPGARIIVEMKVDSRAMGEALARDVRLAGAADRVCAAGYGSHSLAAARGALPEMASSAGHMEVLIAVYRSWIRWPARRVSYGGFQVPELAQGHRIVSPRFLRRAHEQGLHVQVWTVDEEADMKRLLEWGVDALITNRPDAAVRVRDAMLHGPMTS